MISDNSTTLNSSFFNFNSEKAEKREGAGTTEIR